MPPLVQNPELDSCRTAEPKQGTCNMQHDDTTRHGMAWHTYVRTHVCTYVDDSIRSFTYVHTYKQNGNTHLGSYVQCMYHNSIPPIELVHTYTVPSLSLCTLSFYGYQHSVHVYDIAHPKAEYTELQTAIFCETSTCSAANISRVSPSFSSHPSTRTGHS